MLQFDSKLRYPLFHHSLGYESEECFCDGVEHALADVVLTDIKRHAAL